MRILFLVMMVATSARASVCPGPNTVEGIDVSTYQGTIDWAKVKAAGKAFAIIRVSDGTTYPDSTFDKNWSGAKAAGLMRGAYQFFEPGEDAGLQANLILAKMGTLGPGDLPPMLDVEVTGGQSAATITTKIQKWVSIVQAATGKTPLIYTGTWFWDPNVATHDFASYPLVESYYCSNCCPVLPSAWTNFAMWQYSSTGSVSGISGNVDLDKFNGTLAALQNLAGGADYGASFVQQSWPLASTALTMTVNQRLPASIKLKNTGRKAWSALTKLGTTEPRDRTSAFVDGDWLAPNRAASCAGAASGAECEFAFHWKAPNQPGEFHEHFDLVEEGVAWFSDAGQGGPADDQLEAWIKVVEADYHGEVGAVTLADSVATSARLSGVVDVTNRGNKPWPVGVVKLAPTPRDQLCPLAASDWLSPTRVSTVAAEVAPGEVGHFPISLDGVAAGEYDLRFSLVAEGITWFGDAPRGGGPMDDEIKVHVTVDAMGVKATVQWPEPTPKPDAIADGGTDADRDAGTTAPMAGGCSTLPASSSTAFFIVFALLAARRRISRS